MIYLENVCKCFGSINAVNNISLSVKPGEIFGLVGPDGAGKTTLIRMLTGIISSTSGKISVLGAVDLDKIKGEIGYVPQKFSLYGDLTVVENIGTIGSLYGKSKDEIDTLANDILAFTNLLPFKNRLADDLSGGMKQKLALAAGLMHTPKLFFLDEPTTGVDPVSRREFWRMLYRLNKEGMTIFVSTPYMDEADLCTRIAFMHNGQIICFGSPQELKQAYPYRVIELSTVDKNVKQYIRDCPILDINAFGEKYHLIVNDSQLSLHELETALAHAGINVISLIEISPTLEDVFVALSSEVV